MPQFLIYNLLFLTLGAAHVRRIFSFNSLNNKLDWISPSSYKETDEVPISDVKVKKNGMNLIASQFYFICLCI